MGACHPATFPGGGYHTAARGRSLARSAGGCVRAAHGRGFPPARRAAAAAPRFAAKSRICRARWRPGMTCRADVEAMTAQQEGGRYPIDAVPSGLSTWSARVQALPAIIAAVTAVIVALLTSVLAIKREQRQRTAAEQQPDPAAVAALRPERGHERRVLGEEHSQAGRSMPIPSPRSGSLPGASRPGRTVTGRQPGDRDDQHEHCQVPLHAFASSRERSASGAYDEQVLSSVRNSAVRSVAAVEEVDPCLMELGAPVFVERFGRRFRRSEAG